MGIELLLLAGMVSLVAEKADGPPRAEEFVYHIADERGEYDVLCVLPPDRITQGIPGPAIVGKLRKPIAEGGEVTPDNVAINPVMVEFLHAFIARTAPTLPEAQAAARDAAARGDGWLKYIDGRTRARADAAHEDLIGSFTIVDGKIAAETYKPNPAHRVLSGAGLFRLDSKLHPLYLDALVATPVQAP